MPSKKYALMAFLLLATVGLAEKTTYTVKSGDTLSKIAQKVGSNPSELARANGLKETSILRLGMKIQVPGSSKKSAALPKAGYTVRAGDTDSKIAKLLGVSTQALHAANPGVKWSRLQIGSTLKKPGQSVKAVAAGQSSSKQTSGTGTYKVREGENDWVIATRLGISAKALREANPGVNLAKLQIGQIIKVPVTAVAKTSSPGIRTRYATVTSSGVTLRAGATTGSKKLDSLAKGAKVTIIDRKADWYRVRIGENRGWIRGDLLAAVPGPVVALKKPEPPKVAPKPATRGSRVARGGSAPAKPAAVTAALIDHAYSLRGTRYVWGGTSRSGVDCSGFTTNVFKSQGIKLPRTSREQSKIGQAVPKSQLREGDLVFFKTARRSYINHVGIYIGDGKFIHSSSSQGCVRIDRIDSGYYSRQFVSARRVAKSKKPEPIAMAPVDDPIEIPVRDEDALPAESPAPKATPGTDEIIR